MNVKGKVLIAIVLATIMVTSAVIPVAMAKSNVRDTMKGYNKGVSWKPVVPVKKVTFVNFDKNSYLDDYSYLASIPTTVFYDKDAGRIFSYPLLYYQDPYPIKEDKERTLNSRQGIDYFMDDWMNYCDGRLDGMTLINVPKEKVTQWPSRNITVIDGKDPYTIASKLALHDWSYSDKAVVAVIKDKIENPNVVEKGEINGTVPSGYKVKRINFEMKQPNIGVGGNYKAFKINEPYKYVVAHMFLNNVLEDLDLQLYDDQLGMADASSNWNVIYGPNEIAGSYVYDHGKWEVGVTYMPTKRAPTGTMEKTYKNVDASESLINMAVAKEKMVKVDITLYPGIDVVLDKSTPFGCRDAKFKLKWNNPNVALGMMIRDPSGAETAISPTKEEIIDGVSRNTTERTITIHALGETNSNHYSLSIFSLDNITQPIDFTVEYSWHQNITREDGDALASAAEGSILASILNAPLLYVSTDNVPGVTKDSLYKLGVRNIYFVNLGSHSSSNILAELRGVGNVDVFNDYKDIYDKIRDLTKRNDVIISTIDPWSYYYVGEQRPAGEWKGALFVGPAAYIAAHHGVPVLIVDDHPELSQAIAWHQRFWAETAHLAYRPRLPSVACMILTGKEVIKFLEKLGYNLPKDKEDLETMITVAGQYDIGPSWDRTFTGRLLPGRFSGSPVDTAYWIARSVFYPALIFVNPATDSSGITMINGSRSVIKPYLGKLMNPRKTDLVIVKQSQNEKFVYPVLHMFVGYLYKFNEIAKKQWGCEYTCANGITPYETPSPYPIDVGVTDKVGAYYPDISESEVLPIYCKKAGYDNVYATNFSAVTEDLNKGVIMWMVCGHGSNGNDGSYALWNPDSPYVHESNPWRVYEKPLLSPKNWDEFMQYFPEYLGDLGVNVPKILFTSGRIFTKPLDIILDRIMVDKGSTENPDVAVMNPDLGKISLMAMFSDAFGVDLKIKESKGLSLLPIIGRKYRSYHDGIVIDPLPGGENMLKGYNGIEFDNALKNLHSTGVNSVACLVAGTYLHLAFIRHGSVYQIMDPWSTSWYSSLWVQSIPRDLALGYTIGQAYERGMATVGVEYLVNQWWWDLNENVVYFGDPNLRVFVPGTEYSDANHWTKDDVKPLRYDGDNLYVDGHMIYGATSYPHAKQPLSMQLWILIAIVIIVILAIAAVAVSSKSKKSRKK